MTRTFFVSGVISGASGGTGGVGLRHSCLVLPGPAEMSGSYMMFYLFISVFIYLFQWKQLLAIAIIKRFYAKKKKDNSFNLIF